MGSRRQARELALQMLYQAEASSCSITEVADRFFVELDAPPESRAFAERLARGAVACAEEIDALLESTLDNWRLDRLAIVDRCILRMAVFELLHETETPSIVVIDEAIEVAKRYGGEESGQFVNGVLDVLRQSVEESRSRR
jgi:N utilization substance protein B